MAVLPPEEGPVSWMNTDRVLVTPEAQERLFVSDIWFHLGGWYLDGDTYDTQEEEVRRQLKRFWADLVGPEEHFRQKVMEAMNDIDTGWQAATVLPGGHITIRLADGQDKVIAPPACGNPAAT